MNADADVAQAGGSLGATLRVLREARQLDLLQVSARLKFSVRQLQALEEEDWTRLPSGVVLRGMVKNYGRFLQTDCAPLLTMLDAQTGAGVRVTPVLTPISLGDVGVPLYARQHGRPWVWMLLIVGVLLVIVGYAIARGWMLESLSMFDWLRALAA